jgi:hypothetical protein
MFFVYCTCWVRGETPSARYLKTIIMKRITDLFLPAGTERPPYLLELEILLKTKGESRFISYPVSKEIESLDHKELVDLSFECFKETDSAEDADVYGFSFKLIETIEKT